MSTAAIKSATNRKPKRKTQRNWGRKLGLLVIASFVLLLIAYTLFGYFWAPNLIRQQLASQLSSQLDMEAEYSKLSFNPFTFHVTAQNLKLIDFKQQTWYQSTATEINLDPLKLLWGEINISAIELIKPEITLRIDEQGQLKTPALPVFQNKPNSEPVNLTIEKINFDQANMSVELEHLQQDLAIDINQIELELDRFTLGDTDNLFKLDITTAQDENLSFDGSYNHIQKQLTTAVKFIDIQASRLNQILPPELDINTQSGTVKTQGELEWNLNHKPQINLTTVEIQNLQANWKNAVTIENTDFSLLKTSINLDAQLIEIEQIKSSQGQWQVNLPVEFNNYLSNDSENEILTVNASKEWTYLVKQLNIENWPVQVVDGALDTELTLQLKSLKLTDISPNNPNMSVQSKIQIGSSGEMNLTGQLNLLPLSTELDIELQNLKVNDVSPWIENISSINPVDGIVAASQQLTFSKDSTSAGGSISIENARLIDQNQTTLAQWDQLIIASTHVDTSTQTIYLDQITANQAQGTVPSGPTQPIKTEETKVREGAVRDDSEWRVILGHYSQSDNK